jgi:histidinol-phosphate aminotransferase
LRRTLVLSHLYSASATDQNMNFSLEQLIRPHIKSLPGINSEEPSATIRLDKNENSLGSPLPKWYNRYPDEHQKELKKAISKVKQLDVSKIFIGNGIDECIDLLIRCFCEPGKDNVIVCPPAYEQYEASAAINDIEVKKAWLTEEFQLDLVHLENLADRNTKIIWITSPNNPTGNSLNRNDIEVVLNNFNGLIVVDEAYINFSRQRSLLQELDEYPNLVVMQTLSKAWGLAGLGIGMAFASPEIIEVLNKIRVATNLNQPAQELATKALEEIGQVNDMIKEIVAMRTAMAKVFQQIPFIEKVYPSDTNFLLVKMKDAKSIYNFLLSKGIAVKNVSDQKGCENCLRISIGTESENTALVDALAEYINKPQHE